MGMVMVLSGCVATSVLAGGDSSKGSGNQALAGEAKAPVREGRAWLGIQMMPPKAEQRGVQVKHVFRSSPAAAAGLKTGDLLRSIAGRVILHPSHVSSEVLKKHPGERVEIVLEREGHPLSLLIQLEAFPGQEELMRLQYVGAAAPPLTGLKAIQGSVPLTLPELQGKVVVLDFWASWCVVCRRTSPILNRWFRESKSQDVVFLGISNETMEAVSQGVASFGMEYPVAADPEETTFSAYEASSLPTLFVLDRRGIVRAVEVGFSVENMLRIENLLRELLAEEP